MATAEADLEQTQDDQGWML